MRRRIMLLIAAAAMVAAMFAVSAAPAMADVDRFEGPFLGCFDCGRNIDHFNEPFLGCFDCNDELFDEEHVGHPRVIDGLVCVPVRDVDGRFWECWDRATGELIEF